jgi:hypothetical protein
MPERRPARSTAAVSTGTRRSSTLIAGPASISAYSPRGGPLARRTRTGIQIVKGQPDAAGIDEEAAAEAARELQVGLAAREDVGRGAGEEACEFLLRRGREQAVAAGPRRAVEAEQATRPAEVDVDHRHEARKESEVGVAEPTARPLDDRPRLRVVLGWQAVEQPVVRIAPHHRAAEHAHRSSASRGCGPPAATSPRQTSSSTPRRSMSASTASSATALPWMSAMRATRLTPR